MTGRRGGRGSATELERRYRRWLLAYPAEYRRERGDELVGTLLDLAGPERTRPRPLDIVDLVRAGLVRRVSESVRSIPRRVFKWGLGQLLAAAAFVLSAGGWAASFVFFLVAEAGDLPPHTGRAFLNAAPLIVFTWIGLTARHRRHLVVAAILLTGYEAALMLTAGLPTFLFVFEWLAVIWFRPPPLPGRALEEESDDPLAS